MTAKIYNMQRFKRQKSLNGMTNIEYKNLIFNVVFLFLLLFILSGIFFYSGIKADKEPWAGFILSIVILVFLAWHISKTYTIFKNNRVIKELEYIMEYHFYTTAILGLTVLCLSAYFIIHSWMMLIVVIPFLLLLIWNIKLNHQIIQKFNF